MENSYIVPKEKLPPGITFRKIYGINQPKKQVDAPNIIKLINKLDWGLNKDRNH